MTRTNDGLVIPKDATHMLIVCDTFSYEYYLVFAFGDEDFKIKRKKYTKNMQKIKQVIELKQNKGEKNE